MNIAYIDKDLKYLFVNQKFANRYEKSKEEIIGKKVFEIIPKQDFENAFNSIQKVLAGETVFYESTFYYPNGQHHFLNLYYIPHSDLKGKLLLIIC